MNVAIVGAGIAGLACAHALQQRAPDVKVTVFEALPTAGGHAHTVDVTLDGITHGVDTGFLVFNPVTYPTLVQLFKTLDVPLVPSDMSLSVQVRDAQGRIDMTWAGSNLNTVFAQRRNLLRPTFWGMLRDVLRFNRLGTRLAQAHHAPASTGTAPASRSSLQEAWNEPLGNFLDRHRFGRAFGEWYLLPMLGAIWSCPVSTMMNYPVGMLLTFCHNHGLLQITERPVWHTVVGGSRVYVDRLINTLDDVRLNTPVVQVYRCARRGQAWVEVETAHGIERFDEVVMACHSDQIRRLLHALSPDEQAVLEAVRYQPNRAVLHTDVSVLPTQRAWSAWNYESMGGPSSATIASHVCVHYLINRLQPLPFERPVIVSLNPLREPAAQTVIQTFHDDHPVLDRGAAAAQQALPSLQGLRNTWFAGAWTRYGFHEDGALSGQRAAHALLDRARRGLSTMPWTVLPPRPHEEAPA